MASFDVCFDAGEGVGGDAMIDDFLDLSLDFAAGKVELVWGRAQVESEEAGVES